MIDVDVASGVHADGDRMAPALGVDHQGSPHPERPGNAEHRFEGIALRPPCGRAIDGLVGRAGAEIEDAAHRLAGQARAVVRDGELPLVGRRIADPAHVQHGSHGSRFPGIDGVVQQFLEHHGDKAVLLLAGQGLQLAHGEVFGRTRHLKRGPL
jgi:hypothetical protein